MTPDIQASILERASEPLGFTGLADRASFFPVIARTLISGVVSKCF